jgi:hypothetical protein
VVKKTVVLQASSAKEEEAPAEAPAEVEAAPVEDKPKKLVRLRRKLSLRKKQLKKLAAEAKAESADKKKAKSFIKSNFTLLLQFLMPDKTEKAEEKTQSNLRKLTLKLMPKRLPLKQKKPGLIPLKNEWVIWLQL